MRAHLEHLKQAPDASVALDATAVCTIAAARRSIAVGAVAAAIAIPILLRARHCTPATSARKRQELYPATSH
jgi:hypothetical protein